MVIFMKRSFILVVAAVLSLTTPAFAETTVGVVDVQKVMLSAKAANSVRAQLKSKQTAFQQDLDAKEKQLIAEDESLKKLSTTLERAAFEAKVKDFNARANSMKRDIDLKKNAIGKAYNAAQLKIQTTVIEIVKDIATEKKLNVVLSTSQLLYADDSLDITSEVQKRLDRKLPDLKVNF